MYIPAHFKMNDLLQMYLVSLLLVHKIFLQMLVF